MYIYIYIYALYIYYMYIFYVYIYYIICIYIDMSCKSFPFHSNPMM